MHDLQTHNDTRVDLDHRLELGYTNFRYSYHGDRSLYVLMTIWEFESWKSQREVGSLVSVMFSVQGCQSGFISLYCNIHSLSRNMKLTQRNWLSNSWWTSTKSSFPSLCGSARGSTAPVTEHRSQKETHLTSTLSKDPRYLTERKEWSGKDYHNFVLWPREIHCLASQTF